MLTDWRTWDYIKESIMMYFVVKNDLVRITILIKYTLNICTTNIISTMYFTVNRTEQHYLESDFKVIYAKL